MMHMFQTVFLSSKKILRNTSVGDTLAEKIEYIQNIPARIFQDIFQKIFNLWLCV